MSLAGVFQPESVGSSAISAWVDFWCRTYPNCDPISQAGGEPPGALISASVWQVLTPKQLLLLAQSTSPRESWNHVSILLIQLMKSGLVRYKDVQEQAVAVVRQEWPRVCIPDFLPRALHNQTGLTYLTLWLGIAGKVCDSGS